MAKQIEFSEDARRAMMRGVDTLANAVKVTSGPERPQRGLGKKFGISARLPMMVSPSPRKSNWRIHSKTWVLNWSLKWPTKRTT